jgi:hypothetical protein
MVSLTVSGYGQSDYEAWWNAGSLKRDGGNAGTFSENFQVTGSTIVVVPEPGTLVLIGLAGVAFLAGLRSLPPRRESGTGADLQAPAQS